MFQTVLTSSARYLPNICSAFFSNSGLLIACNRVILNTTVRNQTWAYRIPLYGLLRHFYGTFISVFRCTNFFIGHIKLGTVGAVVNKEPSCKKDSECEIRGYKGT